MVNAKDLSRIDELHNLKDKDFRECKVSSFTLLESNISFKNVLEKTLYPFGMLKYKDFDMGECLSNKNLQQDVVTTVLWQKNKSFIGNNLYSYIAYDYKQKKALVVVLDSNLDTYILGNIDSYLINALESSFRNDEIFKSINWSSKRKFRDFGKQNPPVPTKDEILEMEQKKYEILKKNLLCKTVFGMAEGVMRSRQLGVTKDYQLEQNSRLEYPSVEFRDYERLLIEKAYNIPIYENPKDEYAVIKGFSYESFFNCEK